MEPGLEPKHSHMGCARPVTYPTAVFVVAFHLHLCISWSNHLPPNFTDGFPRRIASPSRWGTAVPAAMRTPVAVSVLMKITGSSAATAVSGHNTDKGCGGFGCQRLLGAKPIFPGLDFCPSLHTQCQQHRDHGRAEAHMQKVWLWCSGHKLAKAAMALVSGK